MTQCIEPTKTRKTARVKLTHLSSCAGCAAKLGQTRLAEVLRQMPVGIHNGHSSALLVGCDTFDDAAVYQLRPDLALVQTVDFFTPIVDDPFDYGQIAAANALSDVFAMGGMPLTALNVLGVPADKLDAQTIAAILRGGAAKADEAGCIVCGGHTIRLPEPVYGLSVTGVVRPDRILRNDAARPGDLLVLTKPIGTGIATTAIKRGLASSRVARSAVHWMKKLNTAGAELARRRLIGCATDVTGFGILGHLGNIIRASGVGAELLASQVPALSAEVLSLIDRDCIPGGTRSNLEAGDEIAEWGDVDQAHRLLLADAQTSGGLLLCVAEKRLSAVRKVLKSHGALSAIVGTIFRSAKPRILVQP